MSFEKLELQSDTLTHKPPYASMDSTHRGITISAKFKATLEKFIVGLSIMGSR